MKATDLEIRERKDPNLIVATSKGEYESARMLIEEYGNSLDFSLEFQDFEKELNSLRTFYGKPTGLIILSKFNDEFVGVTCLRNLGSFTAEIKRMYVKPDARGKGIGRKMLNKAILEAKKLGYRFLRLDTVPDMESAIQLYLSTGFYEIEDYTYNPIPGARFMEYKL